jgi:hypothetical protein
MSKEDFEALMQERPDGIETDQADEFWDGFSIVSLGNEDANDAGMVAHRGVLHEDEYVDEPLLKLMIERRLGFTYEQIRSAYRQGPTSANTRQLRDKIDARLLALSRSGGVLALLAQAVGLNEKTIDRALARAKGVTSVASLENSEA